AEPTVAITAGNAPWWRRMFPSFACLRGKIFLKNKPVALFAVIGGIIDRANRHSAMLWDVGLKSNIRAHCRQPHTATSFLIFLRLKTLVLSCYMRPRNDGEPKLEKL